MRELSWKNSWVAIVVAGSLVLATRLRTDSRGAPRALYEEAKLAFERGSAEDVPHALALCEEASRKLDELIEREELAEIDVTGTPCRPPSFIDSFDPLQPELNQLRIMCRKRLK